MTQPIHTIAEEEPVPNWLKKAPPGYRWQYRYVASPDCLASWNLVTIAPTTPPPAGEKAPASQVTTSEGPSKEAMDAAKETRASVVGLNDATTRKVAEIIDLHFAKLRAQLPEEMPNCTIRFKKCEKGHGWLTADNWVDHGCPTCAKDSIRAERDTLAQQLEKWKNDFYKMEAKVVSAGTCLDFHGSVPRYKESEPGDELQPRIRDLGDERTRIANELQAAQSRIAELEKEVEGFKANNRYQRGHTHGYDEATADFKTRIAELEAQLSAKKDLGDVRVIADKLALQLRAVLVASSLDTLTERKLLMAEQALAEHAAMSSQQQGADKVSDVVTPPPNPPPSDQQGPSAEDKRLRLIADIEEQLHARWVTDDDNGGYTLQLSQKETREFFAEIKKGLLAAMKERTERNKS